MPDETIDLHMGAEPITPLPVIELPAEPDSLPVIELPAEAEAPAGATPKDVHDAWCAERITDGWAHGAAYDEAARTDPRLVHFDLLGR